MNKFLIQALNRFGPLIGLVLVVALFSTNDEVRQRLFSGAGVKTILAQSTILALGAYGMTLVITSGGIDLSAGSVVALASVVGAKALEAGAPALVVFLVAPLMGALVGLINGSIIAGFRMAPFIVTLGMMGIARGASKWISGNQAVNFKGSGQESAIDGILGLMDKGNLRELFPLPIGVWVALGLGIATALLLNRSVFGRHIFAIGSNEATARLCGISVQWKKVWIYTVAGFFFGLAGLMQLSRLSQGDPTTAIGLELEIIAAVVIGGASLKGGVGGIGGSVVGVLIMGVLSYGSSQLMWPNYFQEILIGAIIVLAVGVDRLRQSKEAV